MRKGQFSISLITLLILQTGLIRAQNLVVDGVISSSNSNWGGGVSEAPYNSGTFESTYLSTGCNSNYVMEADYASQPTQTVSGFENGVQYRISFRYGWRNTGCNSSVNPTNLKVEFTDATSVLSQTISVANTVTTLTAYSYVFTNNSATSHILKFSNPGNSNTCGVIIDDISIVRESSPGGIGTTNLSMWIKPSNTGLSNNANVYGLISAGTNVVALIPSCSAPPVFKTGTEGSDYMNSNFNPYITFNGSTQYLQYLLSKVSLIDASSGGSGGTFFSMHQGGSGSQTFFSQQSSGSSKIQGQTTAVIFAQGSASGTNNRATPSNSSRVNLLAISGKSNGLTVKDKNGSNLSTNGTTSSSDYLTVGVRLNTSGSYGQHFSGALGEVITFNTTLTASQMHRVRSYMAAKYGVTLSDNSTTGTIDERNYLASNGTTTYWSYASNSGYHNNVTVIGKDNSTGLNQVKSISTDADNTSLTGNAMLLMDHVTLISSDISYLAAGHNGVSALENETSDVPLTIQTRMKRIWKAQKTGSGIASTVTMTFDLTDFTPVNGSNLRLLVSSTSTFSSASIYAGTYVAPNFTVSFPTTGGMYFTLGSVNLAQTPLPVQLLRFNAKPEIDRVKLDWVTATEINNDYFTIERSVDGKIFNIVAEQDGAGNSNTIHKYTGYDFDPLIGVSFYRLKQTDFDGHYTYSSWQKVEIKRAADFGLEMIPSPTSASNVVVQLTGSPGKIIDLIIVDNSGRIVYSNTLKIGDSGSLRYAIDFKSAISTGMYFVRATSDEAVRNCKLLIR
ncbi:MAG: T9SS type A sorting domain-containing protein [Bacteroidetes bacterium]|nr:T9SS type A sorting domain-containing protein [Bacteroidota bacterium]